MARRFISERITRILNKYGIPYSIELDDKHDGDFWTGERLDAFEWTHARKPDRNDEASDDYQLLFATVGAHLICTDAQRALPEWGKLQMSQEEQLVFACKCYALGAWEAWKNQLLTRFMETGDEDEYVTVAPEVIWDILRGLPEGLFSPTEAEEKAFKDAIKYGDPRDMSPEQRLANFSTRLIEDVPLTDTLERVKYSKLVRKLGPPAFTAMGNEAYWEGVVAFGGETRRWRIQADIQENPSLRTYFEIEQGVEHDEAVTAPAADAALRSILTQLGYTVGA